MATYTLNVNELSLNDYTLIGIHTVLDEYKLAYLLNKYLYTKFSKARYNLDFTQNNNASFYSVYEYTNTELGYDWFLIANVYEYPHNRVPLHFSEQNNLRTNLVPERKIIDYFLKIERGFDVGYILKTIEKINKIPEIITSYEVEVESLKSKDFLIF